MIATAPSTASYLIAGVGKTGKSIANYLSRRQQSFQFYDTRPLLKVKTQANKDFWQEFAAIPCYFESFPLENLPELKAIIVSPGCVLPADLIKAAQQSSVPIYGDIECFAQEVKVPVVGITGTNGKSTVTTLLGEMAKDAKIKVAVAGNIGVPVLERLDDGIAYDLWILELSSFQLEQTFSLKLAAATILNISPDHLDRHHTLEAYIQAKQRIYQHSSFNLYNFDDAATKPELTLAAQSNSFTLSKPTANSWGILESSGELFIAKGEKLIFPIKQLKLKGQHNWQNVLAACALATQIEIPLPAIQRVLASFSGLAHRCQWVRTLDAVEWINDSKGTNVGATVSALIGVGAAIKGKIILIAGGLAKDADFSSLKDPLKKYARAVVLIGQDAPKIERELSKVVPIFPQQSLDAAIAVARTAAQAGDVVLLSPACASFDMFKDFNHRGEVFMKGVQQL